ncbi:MAG TPA: acyl carrier protein [Candidatus Hydrogenedentes bacterium]|nr:acyl carrier protein [Candidatus Hydrogenedentota bacterium]HQM49810.1 acyl carrier protein [Candidatus Hydrogenedentota bacterium]
MALARAALVEYIISSFDLDQKEVDDNTTLFSDGLLDSFCMVSLISYIESEAGIKFRPTEVNLDNLDSVGRILAFIERKSG